MSATRAYWAGKQVVYRFASTDGELLYVGKSGNLPARIDAHRASTPWFAEVAHTDIRVFATHESALAAERSAIRAEGPRYNVRSSTTAPRPARPLTPSPKRRISEEGRELLLALLKVRRMTVRELAALTGGPSSRSTIGNLRSGSRVTCDEKLAQQIQEVLLGDPKADHIFLPRASHLRAVS